ARPASAGATQATGASLHPFRMRRGRNAQRPARCRPALPGRARGSGDQAGRTIDHRRIHARAAA
nr:hypothetical protein [Tanacetum cinerariifolium]